MHSHSFEHRFVYIYAIDIIWEKRIFSYKAEAHIKVS